MSEYKDALTAAMLALAADPKVRFLGYGVKIGGRALGTLRDVPDEQLIETPVAENLMAGMAIGLAMRGLRPVVFIERFDFILNAMDAIVNHLDKAADISRGEFQPAVIFRVVVGNSEKPLFTGATHTQDFTHAMRHLVRFPVLPLRSAAMIPPTYAFAQNGFTRTPPCSAMLVEYKDLM